MTRFKVTLQQDYKEWHRRHMEVEVEAEDQYDAESEALKEVAGNEFFFETYDTLTDVDNDADPAVMDVECLEEDE